MTFSGSRFIRNKNKCFVPYCILLHRLWKLPWKTAKAKTTSRFEKALDNIIMQSPKTCKHYAHKHGANTVNPRLPKVKQCICCSLLKAFSISCSQGQNQVPGKICFDAVWLRGLTEETSSSTPYIFLFFCIW